MLGYESATVNGQLVNVAPSAAFDPIAFGPVYTGGAWNRQGVYTVPPVTPSTATMSYNSESGMPGSANVYPTATSENGNPFSLKKSPVIWALAFLVFSLLMLHFIHYK
jgi:hypothetical protein